MPFSSTILFSRLSLISMSCCWCFFSNFADFTFSPFFLVLISFAFFRNSEPVSKSFFFPLPFCLSALTNCFVSSSLTSFYEKMQRRRGLTRVPWSEISTYRVSIREDSMSSLEKEGQQKGGNMYLRNPSRCIRCYYCSFIWRHFDLVSSTTPCTLSLIKCLMLVAI